MIKQRVTIVNELGLHARAASVFVQTAQRYSSQIRLFKDSATANGKNIMSVMLLAAARNSIIELEIDGEDEAEALGALVHLISNRFGEDR